MKKKLFTLLTLLLCVCGGAWADSGTEKATSQGAKDTPITGTCYTISGTYIAGAGGAQASGMANKGVKFRTGNDGARVVFTVNTGYTIKGFRLYGVSNYDLKSGASEPCIAVTKVEVDGTETTHSGTGAFPAKGSSTSGSVILSDISASETIAIYFDNSNSSGNQINGYYELDWETVASNVPLATSVSPSAATIVVGYTTTLTGSFSGGDFEGEWVSDNESVATVSQTGVVTGVAEGTAHITYQWVDDQSKDAYKATATITVVEAFNTEGLTAVKTYDFANWGATTLSISSTAEGKIFNAANSVNNDVFRCTNEGLTSIAIQAVLSSNKGWTINGDGLYEGSGAGRCAAVCDVQAGQYVEFYHNSETSFYTKNEGEDDGIKKIPLVQEKGHHVFKATEDGMVGFELAKGHYVTKIVIYEKKTGTPTSLSFSATTATATLGESFSAPTLTIDPVTLTGIMYSSSNTTVATVDANTGEVTLNAAGTTTITATFAETDEYWGATASYELTVVDPNAKKVTATFAFDSGAEGQTAVVSAENVFSVTSVGVADMKYNGYVTFADVIGTKMRPLSEAKDDKSQYTKFTVTPKKGITFTPTSISFDALRIATDGNKKLHYYAESGTTSIELGDVNPNRNSSSFTEWSHYTHTISGINATSDEPFSLACYVYGLGTSKDIAFANIVIEGEYSGEAQEETMYTITTSVTPDGAGSISQNPAGANLAEGTAITFTATANTGYKFLNKWTVNGTEVDGATYSVESLSEDLEVVAQFQKLYSISFSAGEGDKGTANHLPTQYVETSFTTPAANHYIARDGYTVTGWTDGENNYGFDEEISLTGDIILSPVFVANTKTVADTWSSDVTVTYGFDNTKNNPAINIEGSTGYYVKRATFSGETIDVAMYIDNRDNAGIEGKRGKTNNVGRNTAQVNSGSKFTLKAVPGMSVKINVGSGSLEATIAGEAYTDNYVYTGDAETIDIIFTMGSSVYLNSVAVTYPRTVTTVDVTDVGYRTFASSKALDFTNAVAGLKAYRAVVSDDVVSFIELKEVVAAGTGMLIKADEGSYEIPVATSTPATIENALVGVTSATEVEAGIFVLMNGPQGVGFYVTKNAFTVGANTAYLPADVVAGARTFIGFEETTAIEDIAAEKTNGEIYNLQGQRVESSMFNVQSSMQKKGLYIMNGKKVLVK